MSETAIVNFIDYSSGIEKEIEIPLNITANDLVFALNEAFRLEMNTEDILDCYLVSDNPLAFLRGNKLLSGYGIRNGTKIIFKRG